MGKFNITQHSRERYIQRIPFKLGENLLLTMLNKLNVAKDITDKVYNECPRYLLHLHEKYKSAGQRILLNNEDNIIFIVKKRLGTGTVNDAKSGIFDVLTCYQYNEKYLEMFKESVQARKETYLKIIAVKKANKAALR